LGFALAAAHCERVEAEDVAKDLEVLRDGLIEVEPEEAATREQLLDGVATEMNLAAVLLVDDMTDRWPGSIRPGNASSGRSALRGAPGTALIDTSSATERSYPSWFQTGAFRRARHRAGRRPTRHAVESS
jgi:hypothetical protein